MAITQDYQEILKQYQQELTEDLIDKFSIHNGRKYFL